MATAIPIAYNPSLTTISGTTQIGVFATGTPVSGFTGEPRWWNSPDFDLGYVIGIPVPDGNVPTPNSGETAYFSFYRSSANTDNAFLSLTNYLTGQSFTGTSNARTWLINNLGYYTNYPSSALTVNDSYEGGLLGYIFQPGQPRYVSGQTHGIIVDINNYGTRTQEGGGTGYTWGCSGTISGLAEVVGSGYTNQQTILTYMNANCPLTLSGSGYNLATGQTTNGYTDWFVPNYIEFNSVASGTAATNLVNFSEWAAYVSSRQESSTLYRLSLVDFGRPPTYIPAGSYNVFKDGSFGGTHNVKLFRYF
jgi:hypothetical protein